MTLISEKDYREHLIQLKDQVFKVLPMYEEENETIEDYIDSLNVELMGLRRLIGDLPHEIWYVKSLATLEQLKVETAIEGKQKKVKKEIFKVLNTIDKQIDMLKGE